MKRPFLAAAVLACTAVLPVAAHAQHQHGTPDMVMAHDDSVPLWSGLGSAHLPVTTSDTTAQKYFDQGLRLVYGFNHPEAILAFRRAAQIDPRCAACWWGVALAYGPNINTPLDSTREGLAGDAVRRADSLSRVRPVRSYEAGLIRAIGRRYGRPTSDTVEHRRRDEAYAAAMDTLVHRFPRESRWVGERHRNQVLDHVQTLLAESMMDLHPWDQWTLDGRPKWNTVQVLANLREVIARDSMHVGACHLNIHAREASQRPDSALACARRLEGLMPAAGHIVHMPSHILLLVGAYGGAVDHNDRAVRIDSAFIAWRGGEGRYPLYFAHNREFLWAAATSTGEYERALAQATAVSSVVTDTVLRTYPWAEHFLISRLLVLTRFGRYDQVLREPPPPPARRMATAMWRYARAIAYARTGRAAAAGVEADSLEAIRGFLAPDVAYGINSARTILQVALLTARGEAAATIDPVAAAEPLRAAVAAQDSLRYDEPPPFYYPVRHSLGAVLMAAGQLHEAEEVYREDLRRNPENGWSLYGLYQVLDRAGRPAEAAQVMARFTAAWRRADPAFQALPGSRF
ncbi:MAG: hypothetical protein JWM27_4186 [Gemmatimonadetes bacterium]|nr:hypothetical protein [Gemmatimonadota bacterium]